jgi:peptidoglycan/xylan/chitin deacetylase (PgdA/CDA1 family)
LYYAPDLVDAIGAARAGHEIASHSFSHVVYGDPGCSRAAAAADLAAAVTAARARGVTLRSFVFPRNVEGHHDVLVANGFVCYRGAERHVYSGLPRPARRIAHFIDHALGGAAPVVAPSERLPGLWNIPASMMFFPRGGLRGAIPFAARVRKARATLAAAIRSGGTFHLWFHPFNLAVDRADMFAALREILRAVVAERDRGQVDVRTMAQVAAAQQPRRSSS